MKLPREVHFWGGGNPRFSTVCRWGGSKYEEEEGIVVLPGRLSQYKKTGSKR